MSYELPKRGASQLAPLFYIYDIKNTMGWEIHCILGSTIVCCSVYFFDSNKVMYYVSLNVCF